MNATLDVDVDAIRSFVSTALVFDASREDLFCERKSAFPLRSRYCLVKVNVQGGVDVQVQVNVNVI